MKLQSCKAGCWIGHHYYGCLIFADVIKQLRSSTTALQTMVDVCAEFGKTFYNLQWEKSVCIKFGSDSQKPDIVLNDKVLHWEIKHGGNVLNPSLHDKDDIHLKWQAFFQQVNKLLADFQGVWYDILVQLFSKYCNSFYGSQMWDLRSLHLQALYMSWNWAAKI